MKEYSWHLEVPKDLEGNLEFRRKLLEMGRLDGRVADAVKFMCRTDFLFFVNFAVWQFNPKAVGEQLQVGPFITYGYQDDSVPVIMDALANGKDLPFEKSRELGASWWLLLVAIWLWLYHDRETITVVSKDEDSVDERGSTDSLFWKIDFVLENLPSWMMPVGWVSRKHRQNGKFLNPETNSVIKGYASTNRAGIGGRCHLMIFDEFAWMKDAKEVRRHTVATAKTRFFISTHTGTDTEFFQLCQQPELKKVVWHWSMHPERRRGMYRVAVPGDDPKHVAGNIFRFDRKYEYPPDFHFVIDGSPTGGFLPGVRSPAYDDRVSRSGSARAAAMDEDIDPSGASNQVFDRVLVLTLERERCRPPFWEGDVRVEDGRVKEMVPMAGGPLQLWTHLARNGMPMYGEYGGACDISTGSGATPSTMSLGNADTGEKILEYANAHIEERPFADLSVALCRFFKNEDGNGAMLVWDRDGPAGLRFGRRVAELGYYRVWKFVDEDRSGKPMSDQPGWSARMGIMEVMRDYGWALKERRFINYSGQAVREMLNFRWVNSSKIEHSGAVDEDDPANAGVNHGDRVIADALCWKMLKLLGKSEIRVKQKKSFEAAPVGSLAWRVALHRHDADVERQKSWL